MKKNLLWKRPCQWFRREYVLETERGCRKGINEENGAKVKNIQDVRKKGQGKRSRNGEREKI